MYLYKILNKNTGKAYIGQTINKPEVRFSYHTQRLKKGTHDNEYLQRSFNKHGIDSFMFYTILKTDDLESLNLYEEQFIKILRATDRNFGYNIRPGGANSKLSEETKRKISLAGMGRPKTENEINLFRQRSKGNTWGRLGKGIAKSEETKNKMSLAKQGAENSHLMKACSVWDKNGNFVGEFKSKKLAADYIGISYGALKNRIKNKTIKVIENQLIKH
jgi:group I intron endonuclease